MYDLMAKFVQWLSGHSTTVVPDTISFKCHTNGEYIWSCVLAYAIEYFA